ncbi:MAG: hypothetical protein INR69_12605 [Mucilaginibacter polytrichastri]|nr:hypothetical protein [Mucilaginibacter polytrichastri]
MLSKKNSLVIFLAFFLLSSCSKETANQPEPGEKNENKIFVRIKNASDVWYYDCKIDAMHNNKQVSYGEIGQDSVSRYIGFPKVLSNMKLDLFISNNHSMYLHNFSTDKSELTPGYYTVTINMNILRQDVTWITTRDNP